MRLSLQFEFHQIKKQAKTTKPNQTNQNTLWKNKQNLACSINIYNVRNTIQVQRIKKM